MKTTIEYFFKPIVRSVKKKMYFCTTKKQVLNVSKKPTGLMVYNQAHTRKMRKIILFAMALIPFVMNAQNTAPTAKPAAFVGSYSFADANGSEGTITMNNPYKTTKNYEGEVEYYLGNGTCVFGGVTNYFYWEKNVCETCDYIEITFSKADYPAIAVKGKSYKSEDSQIAFLSGIAFYIKNGWLYYDKNAILAENPNLKLKLTKK